VRDTKINPCKQNGIEFLFLLFFVLISPVNVFDKESRMFLVYVVLFKFFVLPFSFRIVGSYMCI
jgi:hypothetical protein